MRASKRGRSVIRVGSSLLQTGVLVLNTWPPLVGAVVAADPPAAKKAAPSPESDRQKLLAERNRFSKESTALEWQKKYAEAIAAAEKMLAVERQMVGDAHDDIAGSLQRIGRCQLSRDDFPAARKAREEALSILTKLHGDKDWRVTSARLALQDVEIRSRLTPDERRRLADADEVISHYQVLFPKGEAGIALAERAVETRTKVLGESHPDTAAGLNNLGVLYFIRRNYAKAEPLYRQALEIRTKALGANHPSTVQSLNNLVGLYKSTKDYPKAEHLLLEALADCKKVRGERDPGYAASLISLAELYIQMRAYAKAEPLSRQALEIRKKVLGERHLHTAWSLNQLGIIYKLESELDRAEPLTQQALEIRQEILGEKHPLSLESLNNVAHLYLSKGDYPKAVPLYRRLLELRRKAEAEKPLETAETLNALAWVYFSMGDFANAQPLYRQALDIRKRALGENHLGTAEILRNLGDLYKSMGDYAKAEPLCLQALEIEKKILGEHHPRTATTIGSLGVLYAAMRQYEKAELFYRQALEIREKFADDMANIHNLATCINNLAALYCSKGEYAKAEPLYREALEIRRKHLGERHPHTAVSLATLGRLHFSMGNYAEAERLYRQALEIRKKILGEKHPATAESLNALADLYSSMGDYPKAEPLEREALEISQELMDHALGGLAERQQLTFEATQRFYLHAYLSLAEPAHVDNAAAYGYVLKSKGAVTARQSLIRLQRHRPELEKLFQDLEAVATRLKNVALASPDPQHPEARLHEIEQLTEQKERVEERLAAQNGEFAQILESTELTGAQQLQKLKAALPPRTALVDVLQYLHRSPSTFKKGRFDFEWRLMAFVVQPDMEVKRLELGPTRNVSQAIHKWRQVAVLPDRPRTDGLEFLKTVRMLVWDQFEKHLDGAETILLSPDGPLCQFPFATLPGSKPDTYLIEERTIVVVPLPRLLPQLAPVIQEEHGKSGPESLLLVGDVEYGGSPGQSDQLASRSAPRTASLHNFRKLDHSAAEVAAIQLAFQRHFKQPRVDLLLGDEATESAFRRQAPTHRWLHLATHGFYDPPDLHPTATATISNANSKELPKAAVPAPVASEFEHIGVAGYHPGLLSGLALAGANCKTVTAGQDDGIMTALEVSSLDLEGVELAVLSACETGLGSPAGGEGLLGLQRAFQVAGAKSVMAGLWSVPDRETMLLMQRFYQNVWTKKLPKGQALREAQVWMLKEGKARGLDLPEEESKKSKRLPPKYWAGFVLSGDWR